MRLSPCDFDLLQNSILELHEYRDAGEFRVAASRVFLHVIPADDFAVSDFTIDLPNGAASRMIYAWDSEGRFSEPGAVARLDRLGTDHPMTRHVMKTGDLSPLKFSDFFTVREFRNTEMYCDVYRHYQIERLLGAPIFCGPAAASTINSLRGPRTRDFSERDRLMMNLLRPHFDLARQNAERVSAQRAAKAGTLDAFALTPREREIGIWMARGKTNPEISIILSTRVRTVEKHVENILAKLGVENRTAAALIIARADIE